jgi:hypothetical protein
MDRADLIAALEKAEGPSRELDLLINLTLRLDDDVAQVVKSRRGFDSHEGMSWEMNRSAVVFQKYDADGRCFYHGSYPLPAYTASLDAALSLVPAGMAWRIEPTIPSDARWGRYRAGVTTWDKPYDLLCYGPTPAIALCIAALRAKET